jgi:glycosyltransferase involved in cell wall biosynthesis
MRIAQIAPIVERVPPKKYGGTERMVHVLTEELVRRGHEVTLFASGDSVTSAKLYSVYPRALRDARLPDIYGANPWTMLNIAMAYEMQDEFDIIHDHMAPLSLPTANIAETPVVATMHGPFTAANRRLFQSLRGPGIVSISESQIFSAPGINHVGTVYNGLPMEHYPFGKEAGNYLLYVGRISMEKGVHYAIEVAEQVDVPLIIAAKLDPVDQSYFRNYIEPRLSDRVQWVGEVDEEERNKLMSGARCFLHPVTWREPFGLTLIEAMACGCPVVAFNRGAIPEIVQTGVTGFVVEDTDSMIDAVSAIGDIDRAACRAHALTDFSVAAMTDKYEEIYKKMTSNL